MLKIYDQNHTAVGTLTTYEDMAIESDLETGDKKMTFKVVGDEIFSLACEGYLQTKSDEYVIKNIKSKNGSVEAVINLEALEGTPFESFSVTNSTIKSAVTKALSGTGWSIGTCNVPDTEKRNAGMIDCDALAVINNLCKVWSCEPEFQTLTKKVNIYKSRGSDKGVYFASGFNLRSVDVESDSYDFYTQIIPKGADSLDISSINSGKNYLQNFQYSTKKKTLVWVDESYTDAEALKADAAEYLEELSQPMVTYDIDVIDLAKQSDTYSVLSFGLGDTVTVIDGATRSRTKQRIVHLVEHPGHSEKNSCELSNRKPRFTDMLQKRKNAEEIEVYQVDGGTLGTTSLSKIISQLKSGS